MTVSHTTRRIPVATYRLQLNRDFTFADAIRVVDYLHALGISDCYASPIFRPAPDSTHGYDICSFEELNPTLGTEADFNRFVEKLRSLGMGLLFDMVPNHMSNHHSNRWWADVLSRGRASPFAAFFDIEWRAVRTGLPRRILIPILEDHYWKVLEAGKIKLHLEGGKFFVQYYDKRFFLSPESQAALLQKVSDTSRNDLAAQKLGVLERIISSLLHWRNLPDAECDLRPIYAELAALHAASPELQMAVTSLLQSLNGVSGSPRTFDELDALLQQQNFRLAYWKSGPEEMNCRHFFDIPELVSLRMESPKVFDATHRLAVRFLREGKISGLRIDHPDGLLDPAQYFYRLRETLSGDEERVTGAVAAGCSTATTSRSPLYLVVEKILTGNETLPPDWPVDGTTGYDFLNCVNGIFVQRENKDAFDRIYREFVGSEMDFATSVYAGNKKILRSALVSEWNSLTHRLKRVAANTRYGRDFTFEQLHAALGEVVATFPVYRTYVRSDTTSLSEQDRSAVTKAIADAKSRNPKSDDAIFKFIGRLLSLEWFNDFDEVTRKRAREFIGKFQQITAPAMAKGLEDTALYRSNRFLSLNEVGGDAERFGRTMDEFHRFNQLKAESWPHGLLATSTHDTKRGEDMRARLNVLSEIPDEWHFAVMKWRQLNADKKVSVDGKPAPDANDEYFLYQTLVGAWPFAGDEGRVRSDEFRRRICAYMLKAVREAKIHTSWTDRNPDYESAVTSFVESILAEGPNPFLDDFKPFQRKVAFFGVFNSLSQTLLKLTCPGVPDFYQGTELWDLNLVDPDNRKPVDYQVRRRMLDDLNNRFSPGSIAPTDLDALLAEWHTGGIKLFVIHRGLAFRNVHRELFECGDYVPLEVVGEKKEHACAFARVLQNQQVIIIAPRLVSELTEAREIRPTGNEIWRQTALSIPPAITANAFRNGFTQEIVNVEKADLRRLNITEALKTFPIALLEAC